MLSEGNPSEEGGLDSSYYVSDVDEHAGVKGVRRGWTATGTLETIIRQDAAASHELHDEPRNLTDHGNRAKRDLPAIQRRHPS